MTKEWWWLVIGFSGQAIFSARFLVQWLVSEQQKRCVVPVMFWHLSVLGGLILFVYAFYKRDPVFIFGQGAGLFIYWRNLHLIYKRPSASSEELKIPSSVSGEGARQGG